MTLLLTEIYADRIVFAADRQLSSDGKPHINNPMSKKIFKIPKLNAGIGYFGLAQVQNTYMKEWLTNNILNSDYRTLKELAEYLANLLNQKVPLSHRRKHISGFHLCGYNSQKEVEFWYIRNCDDNYICAGAYAAREDFLARDRDKVRFENNEYMIYRNGDIRAHEFGWQQIDAMLPLLSHQDFRPLRTNYDYEEWVRFKIKIIRDFYKEYCRKTIIGGKIDVFSIIK